MKDESVDIFPLFLSPQGSRDKASAAHWEKILDRDTLPIHCPSFWIVTQKDESLPMSSH
ncbi:hypothetical protein K439DRAFT_1638963, partial [Ramaria rubella]